MRGGFCTLYSAFIGALPQTEKYLEQVEESMKGDVRMSPHEKGEQEDAYTKIETHS